MGRRGGTDVNFDELHSVKVDNLSYRTDIEDVRRLFERYGDIGDVYIPRDRRSNQSRGFGFVRYYSRKDADYAVDRADGKEVNGRVIRCSIAKYRRPLDEGRDERSSRHDRDSRRRSRSRSRDRGGGRRGDSRERGGRSRSRDRRSRDDRDRRDGGGSGRRHNNNDSRSHSPAARNGNGGATKKTSRSPSRSRSPLTPSPGKSSKSPRGGGGANRSRSASPASD